MWNAYRRGRLAADVHLQIALMHAESYPATLMVVGRVGRVFTDRTGSLIKGHRITFPQPFYSATAEYDKFLLNPSYDPEGRPNAGGWSCARYVEAYLNCFSGEWSVTCDQLTLLHGATRRPVNPAASESTGILYGPGAWDKEELG
jgi:hypothetical protein